MENKKTIYIKNARIFDGEQLISKNSITIKGEKIINVGGPQPENCKVIDAEGCTLLPGLIDAHSHPGLVDLKLALKFGVTTTCQMQGFWNEEKIKVLDESRDMADCKKSFFGITAPGGHPSELLDPKVMEKQKEAFIKLGIKPPKKTAATPEEARELVRQRVKEGADYIKIMIEDGEVFGAPGIPDVSDEIIKATCDEAHKHGKMAIAHTMSIKETKRAIECGIDGLMHIFIDKPHTEEIIDLITNSGVFVCPTIVAGASTIGDSNVIEFSNDVRVNSKLDEVWLNGLRNQIDRYPQGKSEDVLKTVKALYDAGVDILAGTDASQAAVPGMVHGASIHHELQLLVKAGLPEVEALKTATSIAARRFNMSDRGRIVNGARADLLLVKGNPVENISDTLSIVGVWRQGCRLQEN